MALYALTQNPFLHFHKNDGSLLTSGKIYFYEAGTSNLAPIYSDITGSTEINNPVILDIRGEMPDGGVWCSSDYVYKMVLKDANDVTIKTADNIIPFLTTSAGSGSGTNYWTKVGDQLLPTSGESIKVVKADGEIGQQWYNSDETAQAFMLVGDNFSELYFQQPDRYSYFGCGTSTLFSYFDSVRNISSNLNVVQDATRLELRDNNNVAAIGTYGSENPQAYLSKDTGAVANMQVSDTEAFLFLSKDSKFMTISTNGVYLSSGIRVDLNDVLNMNNNDIEDVAKIHFNTSAAVSPTLGDLAWNDDDKTLNLGLEDGSVLQIGQETVLRVTNKSGSNILNGTVVYISGAQGNRPTIEVADFNDPYTLTSKTIGVATQDINDNSNGYVTIIGLVRDVDTSSFSEGDEIWLSSNGTWQNTMPAYDKAIVRIGYVVTSHVNNGIILCTIGIDTSSNKKPYHGVYCTTSNGECVYEAEMIYTSATNTLTLSGADTTCWEKGVKFTIPAGSSVTLSGSGEQYGFVLAHKDGYLYQGTSTDWDLVNKVGIAFFYKDDLGNFLIAEERHQFDRSPKEHINMHFNIGTNVRGNFPSLTGYIIDDTTSAGVTYTLTSHKINDEEIQTPIPEQTKGQQKVCAYLTATNGFRFQYNNYGVFTSGSAIAYNPAGTLTPVPLNSYVNYYVISIPAINGGKKVIVMPGKNTYGSLLAATPLDQNDYPFTTRDIPEFVYLYKITYQCRSSGVIFARISQVVKIDKGAGAVSTAVSDTTGNFDVLNVANQSNLFTQTNIYDELNILGVTNIAGQTFIGNDVTVSGGNFLINSNADTFQSDVDSTFTANVYITNGNLIADQLATFNGGLDSTNGLFTGNLSVSGNSYFVNNIRIYDGITFGKFLSPLNIGDCATDTDSYTADTNTIANLKYLDKYYAQKSLTVPTSGGTFTGAVSFNVGLSSTTILASSLISATDFVSTNKGIKKPNNTSLLEFSGGSDFNSSLGATMYLAGTSSVVPGTVKITLGNSTSAVFQLRDITAVDNTGLSMTYNGLLTAHKLFTAAAGISTTRITATQAGSGALAAIFLESTGPTLRYKQTNGAADAKEWDIAVGSGGMFIRARSDDFVTTNNIISIFRSGASAAGVTISTPVLVNSNSAQFKLESSSFDYAHSSFVQNGYMDFRFGSKASQNVIFAATPTDITFAQAATFNTTCTIKSGLTEFRGAQAIINNTLLGLWGVDADDDSATQGRYGAFSIRTYGNGTWNDSVNPMRIDFTLARGFNSSNNFVPLSITNTDGGVSAGGSVNLFSPLQLNRSSADPTGVYAVGGYMYYNTATNKFRGYVDGAGWVNLN